MRPVSAFTSSTNYTVPSSPWHSPVPYLFGGLAAMLCLIALALLILACSYWKISGYLDDADDADDAAKASDGAAGDGSPVFEEKFLVIMPGDLKPTHLAVPIAKLDDKNDEGVVCRESGGDQNRQERRE